VELVFLPPNTTSLLQPCDQGIIQNFKTWYRQSVISKLLLHIAEGDKTAASFSINVLDALYMMRTAWGAVTSETIANCFRHAGFVVSGSATPTSTVATEDRAGPLYDELLATGYPSTASFDDYAGVDNDLETAGALTTKEIVKAVKTSRIAGEESSDDDDDDTDVPVAAVTASQACAAVAQLRVFLQSKENVSAACLDAVGYLETEVNAQSLRQQKQKCINDFFNTKS
jgi:hypothetical protein